MGFKALQTLAIKKAETNTHSQVLSVAFAFCLDIGWCLKTGRVESTL